MKEQLRAGTKQPGEQPPHPLLISPDSLPASASIHMFEVRYSSSRSEKMMNLFLGLHVLDEVDNAIAVSVLVVVPGDKLDESW